MRSEAVTVTGTKVTVLKYVTPCSLVHAYQQLTQTVKVSLVTIYQTTPHYISEYDSLNIQTQIS